MKNIKSVNNSVHNRAIRAAFPHTIPIMAGFLFLGASYGVMMSSQGFSFIYPVATSIFVFAGSMEFALGGLVLSGFDPISAFLLTLMINARHIFYGVSLLERYRGLGSKKIYMIFALCDETFSIAYSTEAPEGVDRGWFDFYVSLLDHSYWVLGATLGGVLGSLLPFEIRGIDFAMTALFVVILLEKLLSGKGNSVPILIGGACSLVALILFGKDSFLIPAMLLMLAALLAFGKVTDRQNFRERSEP